MERLFGEGVGLNIQLCQKGKVNTYIYKYKTQFCICKCERLGTAFSRFWWVGLAGCWLAGWLLGLVYYVALFFSFLENCLVAGGWYS